MAGDPVGLRVTFLDDSLESAGEPITFGRRGDIVVDEDNRFLHRIVGRFVARDGLWWLQNHSRHGVMVLESDENSSRVQLNPGGQSPVPGGAFVVSFTAGQANYAIDCWCDAVANEGVGDWDGGDGAEVDLTLDFGRIPLTAEQHLLCVALAHRRLRGDDVLPTNAEAAAMLGWSLTKLNRKLDYMCTKYSRAGVPGLHGGLGELATDRRRVLVDHVISQGVVSVDDLSLLAAASGREGSARAC